MAMAAFGDSDEPGRIAGRKQIFPGSDGRLYATDPFGIFRYDDNGHAWSLLHSSR